MNTELISEATLGLMNSVQEKFGDNPSDDAEIIAVGIVCIVSNEGMTFTRTYSTDQIHYRALGLFSAAVDTVREGNLADDDD